MQGDEGMRCFTFALLPLRHVHRNRQESWVIESLSKKQEVLSILFEMCKSRGSWTFTNEEVKRVAHKVGFGNPFDATKVDTQSVLPVNVRNAGYCVAHLGKGTHCFIPELKHWYHTFETISEDEEVITWRYRPSLLNALDTGEPSVISFVYNQHILHDFLYEDVVASPKIYVPGRKRADLEYHVGSTFLKAVDVQMEVDLTLEYQGIVTVLEAKSRLMQDFAVYQIFHPLLYYHLKNNELGLNIHHINACYILKYERRERKRPPQTCVRLYLYEFSAPDRLDSIRLVRKAEYRLIRR